MWTLVLIGMGYTLKPIVFKTAEAECKTMTIEEMVRFRAEQIKDSSYIEQLATETATDEVNHALNQIRAEISEQRAQEIEAKLEITNY